MPSIIIESLTKKYGSRTAVAGLTLTFPERGITALCGPSGCGKSTLLSLIAGLEKPTSGTLSVAGSVSASFQDPALLPWRTAAENVNLVLGDRRASLPQAEALLGEVGIPPESFASRPPELSGGMRARVGIARALARKAEIYLLDEPFASLDAGTARQVAAAIRQHSAGALVIAVIHDAAFAAEFADTVITFDSVPLSVFTVREKGTSAEVLPHPLQGAFFQA